MPRKHTIKTYIQGGYYHILNRGVNKRRIFTCTKDYKTFLSYLKQYLSPPPPPESLKVNLTFKGEPFKGIPRQPKNYFQQIQLVAYCLMPNHFHFLIRQTHPDAMAKFMLSLQTRFSVYFNKSHHRTGSLFQGPYKAILIDSDEYLLHLSRYIHLNPQDLYPNLTDAYSSYADYLGIRHTSWIHPQPILDFFSTLNPLGLRHSSYQQFVNDQRLESSLLLGNLLLEDPES